MTYFKAENGAVYWANSDGFAYSFHESTTKEQIEEYLSDMVKRDLGNEEISISISSNIDAHSTLYGSPYSTAAILASMGSCFIEVPEGFEMDSTRYGEIYKITVNENSTLILEGEWIGTQATMYLNTLEETNATITLADEKGKFEGDYKEGETRGEQLFTFADGSTSASCTFEAGQRICLGTLLWNNLDDNYKDLLSEMATAYSQGAEVKDADKADAWYNLSSEQQMEMINRLFEYEFEDGTKLDIDTVIAENPTAFIVNAKDVKIQTGYKLDENGKPLEGKKMLNMTLSKQEVCS